jgi:hypothetical protein
LGKRSEDKATTLDLESAKYCEASLIQQPRLRKPPKVGGERDPVLDRANDKKANDLEFNNYIYYHT